MEYGHKEFNTSCWRVKIKATEGWIEQRAETLEGGKRIIETIWSGSKLILKRKGNMEIGPKTIYCFWRVKIEKWERQDLEGKAVPRVTDSGSLIRTQSILKANRLID